MSGSQPAYLCRPGLSRPFDRRHLALRMCLGGAWGVEGQLCVRGRPGLSALDPGWSRAGDMMCDGVFRQMVLWPLGLSRPSPVKGSAAGLRELATVHRDCSGLPRDSRGACSGGDGLEGLVAERAQEVVATFQELP